MQSYKNTMFELLITPAAKAPVKLQNSGRHELIEFRSPAEDLPLWYDSTADIAALESFSLCVNE